jgi:hypothetical protein
MAPSKHPPTIDCSHLFPGVDDLHRALEARNALFPTAEAANAKSPHSKSATKLHFVMAVTSYRASLQECRRAKTPSSSGVNRSGMRIRESATGDPTVAPESRESAAPGGWAVDRRFHRPCATGDLDLLRLQRRWRSALASQASQGGFRRREGGQRLRFNPRQALPLRPGS